MKSRPILFSAPMIRALLDGRKTQTRRVVKPQPILSAHHEPVRPEPRGFGSWIFMAHSDEPSYQFATNDCRCPYGYEGSLLWVREAFFPEVAGDEHFPVWYRATEEADFPYDENWKPSIHMPRWASRLTLRITEVRVERVQEISREDAIAEGVDWEACPTHQTDASFRTQREADRVGLCAHYYAEIDYVGGFQRLWDAINAKRGYPWEANPWVWVIKFEVIQKNVDEVVREVA